jgi:uncharacterized Ntn-hydrolase superfamily protein
VVVVASSPVVGVGAVVVSVGPSDPVRPEQPALTTRRTHASATKGRRAFMFASRWGRRKYLFPDWWCRNVDWFRVGAAGSDTAFPLAAVAAGVTFSICVREPYEDENGDQQYRFGVAVTTRLPGVGVPCPHVNDHGAVATQSLTNPRLGSKGVEYLADGLAIENALDALLAADDGSEDRQLHGVGRNGEFAFSGDGCNSWYGEHEGEHFTVAGNLLTGEAVVERTADHYDDHSAAGDADPEEPLAKRLVDALGAGQAAGGDKREDLTVQSAAVTVADSGAEESPYWNDLRVDASEDPVVDLRETYRLAKQGYEDAIEKYGDPDEEDAEADAEDAEADTGDTTDGSEDESGSE